jgi:hypothetical protein
MPSQRTGDLARRGAEGNRQEVLFGQVFESFKDFVTKMSQWTDKNPGTKAGVSTSSFDLTHPLSVLMR